MKIVYLLKKKHLTPKKICIYKYIYYFYLKTKIYAIFIAHKKKVNKQFHCSQYS